ncbi:MAG: LysR family transcriptional regulator [Xanthobacteraceae bacterium]|nr:LysR family transcriptional regulator [Xanthobacteraceae bacterium]
MRWDDRISSRLTLRDLHVLMSVAQSGSMGKAAKELAISQPAISKAIGGVEHLLKVKLFDRTPTGVQPTRYGRSLLKCGSAVFDDLRQGVNEIEQLSDPTVGELRLGCTEPMSSGFVPAIMDRLAQRYPKMVFHVTQGDPAALQERELRSRNIELAVGRIPEPFPLNDLNVEVLFEESVFVATALSSKWARRRKVRLAELMGESWSLPPPGSVGHSIMTTALHAAGLTMPRSTVVTYSLHCHYALMATGRYLGLIPGSLLHFDAKRLGFTAVQLDVALNPGPAGIVTLKNRTLSPIAELFIETARELAQPMAKNPKTIGRSRSGSFAILEQRRSRYN